MDTLGHEKNPTLMIDGKPMTKESKDFKFTALAYMGNASSEMSWANNCVEDITQNPEELKSENEAGKREEQDELRVIRNGGITT